MAKQIDLNNEQIYLSNLASTGDEGQRVWAQNKAKEYGITLGQANTPPPTQIPATSQSVPSQAIPQQIAQIPMQQASQFNQQAEMAQMMQMNQQMADAGFQQQKAQLDMMLESQIAQLKMAYDQAITDGQISVRDAEAEFQEQSKAIEQQAYQDAERMGLYTQDMGIQNSQQAVGLMQGDNARKNSMINQNMTTRDKRVNDIKDRLNSIKTQKNIELSKVQAEHGYGVLGARASANQQISQNAFGLMQDNYTANRDQNFAQQNMYTQQGFNQQNMATEQGYNRENMETQFQNSLKSATHDSNLAIDRMNIQQGFDLDKMSQMFKDDMAKMAKQFGYSSSLNAQEQANRIEMISKEYEAKVKAEEDTYERDLERNLRGVQPGTKEYELITGTAERELKQRINELHTNTVYEAVSMDIFENTPSSPPSMPTNHKDNWGDVGNLLSGYEGKMNDYNAMMDAYNRRLQFMEDPYAFMNNK